MEVILYIFAALIALGGIFVLIEYPYHFIGIFIFIIYYQFNIELPGPLDLRGWLTIILLFRLIVFDKENLRTIIELLIRNNVFLFLLVFEILLITITISNGFKFLKPVRMFVFQMIGFSLGFIAVYRGYTKQVFFTAIIATGIIGAIDLAYSYGTSSSSALYVTRVLDVFLKSEYSTELNHNIFGLFNGIALCITYVMFISKQIRTKLSIVLILIFGTGILLSTSRATLITVVFSIIISTIFLPKDQIDVKKIVKFGFAGIALFIVIASTYLITLKALNVDSKFTDKVYHRLVEEPISLLEGKKSYIKEGQNFREGSMSWRIGKALRDFNEFSKLEVSKQLTGFGAGGYSQIGEEEFDRWGFKYQISSHNGIVTIIIERGIVGLLLFILLNVFLLNYSVKSFRKNSKEFPFYIFLIFTIINTFGSSSILLSRFGFIIMGGIIGQSLYQKYQSESAESE